MVFFSTDTCSYSVFTASLLQQGLRSKASPQITWIPQILSSPGSHVVSPDSALALCRVLYKSSFPDLGRLQAPEEPEEQQGWLRSAQHWSVPLHPSLASPCSHLTARLTLPTPLPSSSPGESLKAKWLNSKHQGTGFSAWCPYII